jgi:hypothetical protein
MFIINDITSLCFGFTVCCYRDAALLLCSNQWCIGNRRSAWALSDAYEELQAKGPAGVGAGEAA